MERETLRDGERSERGGEIEEKRGGEGWGEREK